MDKYPRFFLQALATWQRGWKEQAALRRKLILDLRDAVTNATNLPIQAVTCPVPCYRKRFLVPNNAQNGGDFWPLFADNEIMEGISSWSTDYNFARVQFKKTHPPGQIATMFCTTPKQSEILLNVPALWTDPDFTVAVDEYVAAGGTAAGALHGYRHQSEVILRTPLRFAEIKAFCGQVPSLQDLCKAAGVSSQEEEDVIWEKLAKLGLFATMPYWIEDNAAKRAALQAAQSFYKRMFERVNSLQI